MADASHPFDSRRRRPRDWGDAFANLPLDAPPLSAWSQIAARLDAATEATQDVATADILVLPVPAAASPRSARRRLSTRSWLALAASLSALALLPMLWSGKRETSDATTTQIARIATGSMQPASNATARSVSLSNAPRDASASAGRAASVIVAEPVRPLAEPATGLDIVALEAAPQLASAAVPASTSAPLRTPLETIAPDTAQEDGTQTASVDTDALPANAVLVGDADADATDREMELLYAASAQLETLLAYTRDPRVETGPAAALSSEIHTRLAKIDARLAQPGLSTHEQYALWQARVGALRQAVAFESELRALSAEGQGYEGQLVEVY